MNKNNKIIVPEFKITIREDLAVNDIDFTPTKSDPQSVGFDCRAALPNGKKEMWFKPGSYVRIPLGFRILTQPGWWYQLHPRSSFFAKKHCHTLIGTIDPSFTDELQLCFQYLADDEGGDMRVEHGERIAQIIPFPVYDFSLQHLSKTDFEQEVENQKFKRTGGIGSSGTK